jgi:cytochrome c biogenesis protein CcmG/thiol:disulfide interchange protein DsbE
VLYRTRLAALTCLLTLIGPGIQAADAPIDLSRYRGKVVVVDFWASWCAPCRRSFPWMNEMQAKYADEGLIIIGVNMDTDTDLAAAFLEDYPAQFMIAYDPDGSLARQFDVIAMPSTFVLDRDGNQVTRHLGFKVRQQDEYEAVLVEALDN